MFLSRTARNSDPLGRYYTEPVVSAALVNAMEMKCPSTVIDICVGDGALVGEAARVWKNSSFITADIEVNISKALLQKLSGREVTHYVGDALDLRLAERIGFQWGQAEAALCNPPYINPEWNKQFLEILEDAGLSHVIPRMREIPADLLFIAQNLRLLRQGGRLGLILPDGIVAGERFSIFRETLLYKHRIERVIELPRRIFRKTDAKAHIIVVSKHGTGSEFVSIQRLDKNGELSPQLKIATEHAVKRLDYSFNIQNKNDAICDKQKIGDVAIEVLRGTYSSIDRKCANFPIFHTSDFSIHRAYVPKEYILSSEKKKLVTGVIAVPGDILVARVGRNLEKKVCMVNSGSVVISDCILLLRMPLVYREVIFSYLRSQAGCLALDGITHGVAAKFITVHSLLELTF